MSAATHAPVSPTRRALPYAALLFLLVGAHGLLETARDGMFLVEQPVTRLPWLYLAVTAGVVVLTPVQRRLWSGRLHVALPLTLAAAGAVTLGFWAFAAARSTVLGFYVWTALFSSLVFVQFWLTADEAFSVDEAKRAFGFIAAGGLLGAVCGTGAARIALDYTAPETLLLISAGATVAGAGLALVAIRASRQGPEAQPEMTAARAMPGYVKRDPYLRLLAVLALLTAASATLIDYLFKAAVAGGIAPERIPRLVANVYLGQSALALVVELVLVGLLLRSSGVTRSLALLPMVVLAGATGYAVGAGLVAMLVLKTVDGGLRPSLYRVGTELLFLPIGPAERRVVKPSIDTLGQRGGQALASLLLLALPVLPERHQIAAATVCLALVAVAWVQATVVLRRRYLERFQRELGEGRVTPASIGRLDLASAEVLVAGLGSSSVREVLAALDVLAGSGRLGLIPALILYHPDPLVVRSALRLLSRSQRPDVDALLPFLLRHPDDQVRATAAARWAGGGHRPDALLRVALEDPSPKVRASALIAGSAGSGGEDALASLAAIAAGPDLESRRALAWAIGNAPRPDLLPVIETLFLSGDVETRRELLRAAPGLPTPPPEFVSQLISLLVEPALRPGVREALVSIGTPALIELERLLLSPDTPYALVRELPASIARFPAEPATGPLLGRLVQARRSWTASARSGR
jgi:AAA family ATP:ADP antiporter